MSYLQARIAAKRQTAPQFVRVQRSFPAPVLGWNARDSLAEMDPRFAVAMDNYFPDGTKVRLRNGCVDHATGFPAAVETLHTAAFGNSTKLVAFSGPNAYDITSGGAIGAPLATGFTNSQWFGVNAGPKGGERALYTNGADAAQSWDGTTWAAAGFTGPTKPIGAHVAHKRFWTIENG